ncbi:MAG: ECF transporter S component [Clostridia bacterium]|nr:ECF transporter S component [Clostridia bacterium]
MIILKTNTRKLVLAAILTALVVVLQFMGAFIKLGPFSISLVLIPIVIGAATCGTGVGAWLGLVFGLVVLWSGDAAAFLAIDVPGTIITVLAKGTLCGLVSGLVYKAFASKNKYLAVFLAAIACPLVNTGIFLLGCVAFFMDTITQWAAGGNIVYYMLIGLVGGNFLFELGANIILSPVVVRLLNIRNKY